MTGHLHHPTNIKEALDLLKAADGVLPLAGGATLVAMMNAGLVEPRSLVSLRAIPELGQVQKGSDGSFALGAMRRHRQTAEETPLEDAQMLLAKAAGRIANPTVRNMGTLGGSIAFNDPGADYPPALVAANATILIAGPQGRRELNAGDFFVDWYTTALEAAELVVGVRLPPTPKDSVGHYEKLARVSGDFAMASIALQIGWSGDAISFLRLAVGGCGPKPIRLAEVERLLLGVGGDAKAISAAGKLLADAADPVDDVRASADYRRRVIPRLLKKTLDILSPKRTAA